jgi:LPS sulfotransferase NodH
VSHETDYGTFLKLLTEREACKGLFAMKLMYRQFLELSEYLMAAEDLSGKDLLEKFTQVFPNPCFIRVRREDTVAQAVSLLKARQTGEWISRPDHDKKEVIEPVYSFLGINNALKDRQDSDEKWDLFLNNPSLKVLELSYEQLVADKKGTLLRIMKWAGLSEFVQEIADSETVRPMTSSVNRDWVARFNSDLLLTTSEASAGRDKKLLSCKIHTPDLLESYELGKRYLLNVKISSEGAPPNPAGAKDGTGWLRVTGLLSGKGFRKTFEQELQCLTEGVFCAPCILPAPVNEGRYLLKLVLSSRTLSAGEVDDFEGVSTEMTFCHPTARSRARKFLPGISDLPDSWQYLDWFGYLLDDQFPWVYHSEHEWLFFREEIFPDGSYRAYDTQLGGWITLDPHSYPEVTLVKSGQRWVFLKRIENKRLFKNVMDGCLREFETNRPEHLESLSPSDSWEALNYRDP